MPHPPGLLSTRYIHRPGLLILDVFGSLSTSWVPDPGMLKISVRHQHCSPPVKTKLAVNFSYSPRVLAFKQLSLFKWGFPKTGDAHAMDHLLFCCRVPSIYCSVVVCSNEAHFYVSLLIPHFIRELFRLQKS